MGSVGNHHPWDNSMKRLFTEASSSFVSWLMQDATFVQLVSPTLEGEDIEADILCETRLKGQKTLFNVEFQKKRDAEMGERLWNYNVHATIKYKCPVWSYVIYLTKDSTVESPYSKAIATGQTVHCFFFTIIKLWEIPTQELLQTGLSDLAPLLPLTREGQRQEVIEKAIELLDPPDGERRGELLTLTYGIASLIFASEADQDWLSRRFGMLYDILKDTRAFQDLAREGRLAGLEEGRQEGRQAGLQEAVLEIVEARFADPALVEQARTQVAKINDLEVLRSLIVKVALLQNVEEVAPLLAQFVSSTSKPATGRKRTTRASRKKTME